MSPLLRRRTARLLGSAWLDPTVAASSEHCDITPARFFDGAQNSLYLVAPPSNQDRLRVVFNMVVKQFVDAAYAHVLTTGRPVDRRVLIVIDELAIYGNIRSAQLELRPWFANWALTRRARHIPPGDQTINPQPAAATPVTRPTTRSTDDACYTANGT